MKQTKREKFLAEMGTVLPWQVIIALIDSHHLKLSKNGGLLPPLPGKLTPLHPDHFFHQGA